MDKTCTFCGRQGHRASQCPHHKPAAEACTDVGIEDDLNEPLIPTWVWWFTLLICLFGYVTLFFVL